MPINIDKYKKHCTQEFGPEKFNAVFQAIQDQDKLPPFWILFADSTDVEAVQCSQLQNSSDMHVLSKAEIGQAQKEDPVISRVIKSVSEGVRINQAVAKSPEEMIWLREWPKLFLDSDVILRRRFNGPGGKDFSQLALPSKYSRKFMMNSTAKWATWSQRELSHWQENVSPGQEWREKSQSS